MSVSLVSTSSAGNNLTTSGPVTIAAPSSISANNILIAIITSDAGTIAAPSGWTLYSTVTNNQQISVFWKVATGSEPSTYVFTPTPTNLVVVGQIFNISNASLTAPISGMFSENTTTAAVTAGATSGTPSIPTVLNCLPIAVFTIEQLNPSNQGAPTGLTSGWTGQGLNVIQDTSNYFNTGNANGYDATFTAIGPLTSSTSTAVTASVTWPNTGPYDNLTGLNAMLFIAPLAYGTLAASPSSPTVSGLGTGNAVQETITESGYTGNFTVNVPTAYQSIVSVATTQTGSYGTSCSIAGPSSTFWIQGLSAGNFQLAVSGG